ncbi:MAG: laccase domain-containing protein [Planctomycetota bacterium]|nr:MAG: laccase domain-containing protein [Planctomycetota bacterium]
MREIARDGRVGLAFESLVRRPELVHVFTTRGQAQEAGPRTPGKDAPAAPTCSGNLSLSGGRDRQAALAERRFWSAWLDLHPEDWVVGGQVHGARIAAVGEGERGRGASDPAGAIPGTDGLVTTIPGLPLYTAVADCAAVLLLRPGRAPALGLIHAGWRGLRDGVLRQAAAAMGEPDEVLAGISPCIGLLHFEVGEEVAEHAPPRRRIRYRDRWHVDLAGWANDQLLQAGLRQAHVEVSGLDTFERPDLFFSHRRDGPDTGRMGLVAALRGPAAAAGPPRS